MRIYHFLQKSDKNVSKNIFLQKVAIPFFWTPLSDIVKIARKKSDRKLQEKYKKCGKKRKNLLNPSVSHIWKKFHIFHSDMKRLWMFSFPFRVRGLLCYSEKLCCSDGASTAKDYATPISSPKIIFICFWRTLPVLVWVVDRCMLRART